MLREVQLPCLQVNGFGPLVYVMRFSVMTLQTEFLFSLFVALTCQHK